MENLKEKGVYQISPLLLRKLKLYTEIEVEEFKISKLMLINFNESTIKSNYKVIYFDCLSESDFIDVKNM